MTSRRSSSVVPPDNLDTIPDDELDQALDEQRRHWRNGDRRPVEALVSDHSALVGNRDAMLDLIYQEVVLREHAGEHPRLEEYLARFPGLAEPLRVQFELERALEEATSSVASSESNLASGEHGCRVNFGPDLPSIPDYEVLEVLGHGGMGVVYKARHLKLKRLVALKTALAGGFAGADELQRFRREAETVARLQHANIVQIYEIGEHGGQPFMALEFVDGNLSRRLAGTPVPPRQAAQWLITLARAIQYAHEHGIIHRDLKPSNVLIGSEGILKIADFGMAKLKEGPVDQTPSDIPFGTPSYMSPEQALGRLHQIGPPTDVYGLGAILYELLTGRPPFRGNSVPETLDQVRRDEAVAPSRFQQRLPRDLETICLCCLRKDPAKRYATADALAADLTAFLAGEPIHTRSAGRIERTAGWARRRPVVALLSGAAAAALIGLLVGIYWFEPLPVAALIAGGLLVGGWWYNMRLQKALRDIREQQIVAERSVERLHMLMELTRQLFETTDPDEMLLLLARTSAKLVGAEWATVYCLDEQRAELWSKVTIDQTVGEIRLPIGVGLAGAVAATGEPIAIADAYADDRFNRAIDQRTGFRTRNLLTVPIKATDGNVIGVFQIVNKREGAFEVHDVEILTSFAGSAALAIDQSVRHRTTV
jgi:serine/threonine-protein kinase